MASGIRRRGGGTGARPPLSVDGGFRVEPPYGENVFVALASETPISIEGVTPASLADATIVRLDSQRQTRNLSLSHLPPANPLYDLPSGQWAAKRLVIETAAESR